ncbi:MAG TPA: ribonuclease J [Chloroflexi bacterium]|nr:ribonuclease J [Chloroflexota bacterium]
MVEKKLKIIPLGGFGEVGKNMMLVEYEEEILIIDTGLMFPESNMLGVDYIIPDFSYLDDKLDKVRGIVITHGHEDHTGAIRHVVSKIDAPIYATPFTCGLLRNKLRQAKSYDMSKLKEIRSGDEIEIGLFKVEPFHVCHSIPDSVGLAITTPMGLIVHSGDFKLDKTPTDGWCTDLRKLDEFAERGVLALLSDSTNADQPGWTKSESVIDDALDNVFSQAHGRVLVATFASLVSRVQQVLNAADRHGRYVAIVGTSMINNTKMALKLGYIDDPNNVLVSLDKALDLPKAKVALMMTGSQGEPSSILARLSVGRNRQFDLEENDTVVVSAHPIPGNEELVSRTINRLIQKGAKVIYDPIESVHVSGHAKSEEQKQLIQMVEPKYFIPIHGELRMLHAHASLAEQVGMEAKDIAVVENGTILELTTDSIKVGERYPGSYVYVDGKSVGDIGPQILRERDRLGSDGFVMVNIILDIETQEILKEPVITTKGFLFGNEDVELIGKAKNKAKNAIDRHAKENVVQKLEQSLADYFYSQTNRRPYICVLLNEV